MSPIRRDSEGARGAAASWESISDRLIREAHDRGEFDELPGRGKPLALHDETYAGEMGLAHHMLRNAGVSPPWIEADKEVRRLRHEHDRLLERAARASTLVRDRHRKDLVALVEMHNRAVDRVNAEAPSPAQHRAKLALKSELERLEALWPAPEE